MLRTGFYRCEKNIFAKNIFYVPDLPQNTPYYIVEHFWTHFALFYHHFIRFWGDLLKKLRLGATLKARLRGSERGSAGSKKTKFPRICFLRPICHRIRSNALRNSFTLISRCFIIISIVGAICLRNYAQALLQRLRTGFHRLEKK